MRFEERVRLMVSPERLWPLISDTSRLNRAIGLPSIKLTTEPLTSGGSRTYGEFQLGAALMSFLGQVFPISPARVADEALLRRLPRTTIARWIENPFEWEAPRRYAVSRDYYWSLFGLFPFRTFRAGVELVPTDDGGTEATAFADIEPRNAPGALLCRFILGPRNVRAVAAQCRNFERYLLGEIPHPYPALLRGGGTGRAPADPRAADFPAAVVANRTAVAHGPEHVPPGAIGTAAATPPGRAGRGTRWDALVRAGARAEHAALLREHLERAPDDDVQLMRPYELADRWNVGRRETLIAFLHATVAGLLEMSWSVLCPNCRVTKAAYGTLAELKDQAHCETCNITFDAAIDRLVEVRFSAAEAVRSIENRQFCTGGPMNLPHVVAQVALDPGDARRLALSFEPGSYRARTPHSKGAAIVEVGGDTAPTDGRVGDDTGGVNLAVVPADRLGATSARVPSLEIELTRESVSPAVAAMRAGTATVRVTSALDVPTVFVLERLDWPDTAVTAAMVGTIQEFRDLFASEVLAPGLTLSIQRLAFLFTDLTGSTAMYQALGQARAFRLVQDHFTLLGEAIRAHRGAIVKTIGDAIMAVFPEGSDAFAAALAMQREIRRLPVEGAIDTARFLKIGIHEGPCIAVNANRGLDYFGTTINIAARVQHESRGGEVLLTEDVFHEPAVQERVRQDALALEPAEANLRGIRAPVKLFRIPDPVPEAAPLSV